MVDAAPATAAVVMTATTMIMIRVTTPTQEPAMLQHLAEAMDAWYCASVVADEALHADNMAAIPQNQPCKQKMLTRPQIWMFFGRSMFKRGKSENRDAVRSDA